MLLSVQPFTIRVKTKTFIKKLYDGLYSRKISYGHDEKDSESQEGTPP